MEGTATTQDAAPPPRDGPPVVAARHSRFHRGSAVVALVGVIVTLVLALGAASLNTRNEHRLLRQRAREIGLVSKATTTETELPLQAGVYVALGTGGNAATFRGLASLVVGSSATAEYASASLWRLTGGTPTEIATVGAQQAIAHDTPAQLRVFFSHSTGLTPRISDLLDATPRRVGYLVTSPGNTPAYAIYAETNLPKNRTAKISSDQAFSDLNYALYLGKKVDDAKLIASSAGHGLTGHLETAPTAFGNTTILVAVSTSSQLGGTLLLRLPWLLAALGIVLILASTFLAERLIRRREGAEALAGALDVVATENARLYNEQRSVARTLQHTLLPAALPDVGLEVAARYVAGEVDVEIGGDWYDLVPLPGDRVFFVIGDVSGRGIPAATVMASLRYSLRAYAVQGDAPDVILVKLARLLSIKDDGHFATVFCGRIDLVTRRLEAANAGHLDPLLMANGQVSFLDTQAGVPVGAMQTPHYRLFTTQLPASGTLLLYTDGLIERRGESLDVGFSRLAGQRPRMPMLPWSR
ncbi:MAG TPA: SpoIIE family protein phosphatase [Acidimicrobiia bacterium]